MKKLLLIVILGLPTIALLANRGIYTMHDFHLFRLFEFNQCISQGVFPCRWSPNAGKGFGEPTFNYYGQFPYWVGQLFIFFNFSIIDSLKITFALTILLSGLSMYFLSKRFWGSTGAIISSIFYMFAPYRAVDVWVRGALPESFSFVFFPLILLSLETKKYKLFTLLMCLLLITHNLSFFMFMPFMGIWWLVKSRDFKFIFAGVASLILSSFYLIPLIFERNLVTLSQTTSDYYSFALHFVSLKQLFISANWGYGGSIWGPNDTMSFSVGTLHWIVSIIILVSLIGRWLLKKINASREQILVFILGLSLSLLAAFLTHGKSEIIWKSIPGLAFVQFPWRFLTIITLFLSICAGFISKIISVKVTPILFIVLILLNSQFFKPDIWKNINDAQAFSGSFWDEQRSSALGDYWPITAKHTPTNFASINPEVAFGIASLQHSQSLPQQKKYIYSVETSYARVLFPINYFPGWTATVNGSAQKDILDSETGLIALRIPKGNHEISLKFINTPIRIIGNGFSVISLLGLIFIRKRYV